MHCISISSKVRHDKLCALSKEAALQHLASNHYFVSEVGERLRVRNSDNTARSKEEIMLDIKNLDITGDGVSDQLYGGHQEAARHKEPHGYLSHWEIVSKVIMKTYLVM